DGTITTQPEFAFFFDDVGWGIENYGTDPDVEVDNAPQDYARGADPQLDRSIETALALLAERPPHSPVPAPRPRFTAPRLAPRPAGRQTPGPGRRPRPATTPPPRPRRTAASAAPPSPAGRRSG